MKISFLIRGKDLKDSYAKAELPSAVKRTIGTYASEGGNLYFATFSIERNTIADARVLAALRDSLPTCDNSRILHDEASAKFCELLYPHFCRFEKGLREAITVATCAVQCNFDDERVVELEEKLTLEKLYTVLFVDSRFIKEARNLAKGDFTREDLLSKLESLDETLLWDVLFDANDMPTFRKRRIEIKDRRNDVMHYHRMTEVVFDETRELMKVVNAEIDAYLEQVRNDVTYPKAKAESARVAAQMMSDSYAEMLESIRSSFDMSDMIDVNSLASVAQIVNSMNGGVSLTRAAQEAINWQAMGLSTSVSKAVEAVQASMPEIDISKIGAMQDTMESVKSMLDAMNAQLADSFKGISDYYQQILPSDALDNLRLAAGSSMDFTAGLGVGSALSHLLESGERYRDGECDCSDSGRD